MNYLVQNTSFLYGIFCLSYPVGSLFFLGQVLLTLGLSLDERDFFEALKGIQRGLDDLEQGQFSSLEAFIAEQNQKYGLSLEA